MGVCLGVSPRGPEGGAGEGAGPRAQQPRAWEWGKRSPSAGGEVGPGGRMPRERAAAETRARSVRCRLTGRGCGARAQARSSTYLRGWKWAGMGRNTVPEVKPPNPPLVRSGRRAGRKSVTLTRPSPSAFLTGAPSPQP